MGGKSSEQTVAYKYYVGMHNVLTVGVIDQISQVSVDDKIAWSGACTGGQLTIDQQELFGGESREGGISGTIDVLPGGPTQTVNDYLSGVLGTSNIPAFRGVGSVVLRQCYVGLNYYLKKWSWRTQRIKKDSRGSDQWYLAKAAIPVNKIVADSIGPQSTGWKYFQTSLIDIINRASTSYDDSSWSVGFMPFSSTDTSQIAEDAGFPQSPVTTWSLNTRLWLRKTFNVYTIQNIYGNVLVDNYVTIYVNGKKILNRSGESSGTSHYFFLHDFTIPASVLNVGENIIALMCEDVGNVCYASMSIYPENTFLDMNPSHIIREIYTDSVAGYGVASTEIDDDYFTSSADTLYTEGLGLSFYYTGEDVDQLTTTVLEHINGVLRTDQSTGKIQLKLIRNDYDVESLITLDESNISSISDITRPLSYELVNEIKVKWWNPDTSETSIVTVQNAGAIASNDGNIVTATKDYTGVSSANLAVKLGARDLKDLGTDRLSCSIVAKRIAYQLNKGDAFLLSHSKYGIDSIVMRVISIDYGDGIDNSINIKATQDTFSFPDFEILTPDETLSLWTETKQSYPTPISNQLVFEVPYLALVKQYGQGDVDSKLADNPDIGYVGVAADSPNSSDINAILYTDSGAGYEERKTVDFCPYGTLGASIGYTDTSISVANGVDLDSISPGTWAQIEDEIVIIDDIDGSTLTIRRGCLDTIPDDHAAGSEIYFWDNYAGSDGVEYADSESINVKLLTVNGSGVLDIEDAIEGSLTIDSRAIRPYPPANITINDEYYPTSTTGNVTVEWAHRDRTQQTSGTISDWFEASIGPEEGTTYSVTYKLDGNVLGTVTGISGTYSEYIYGASGTATVIVSSVRGGYTCSQIFEHSWDVEAADGSAYRYYRIYITANNGSTYTAIQEIELAIVAGGADITSFGMSASESSAYSNSYGIRILDEIFVVATGAWVSTASGLPQWVYVDLGAGNAQSVVELRMWDQYTADGPNRAPKDFVVQGSNDASTWTDIKSFTGITGWVNGTVKTFSLV